MSSTKKTRKGAPLSQTEEKVNTTFVKRNARGGVLVTPEEIKGAFSMLDVEKTGVITLAALKKRLGVFYPEMTAKDFRFLMNNKKELTVEDLSDLIVDNDLTNFDPVAEAFRLYDTHGTGYLDADRLRSVFKTYGFSELSDEELDILTKAADFDGDGRISLADFRNLIDDPAAVHSIAANKTSASSAGKKHHHEGAQTHTQTHAPTHK